MANLFSLTFKTASIRTFIQDDNYYFCLADVCKILNLKNPTHTANQIKQEFSSPTLRVGLVKDANNHTQSATFITEPQLYFVMNRSQSKEAQPFRMWVNNEVLPAIRKHGFYSTNKHHYDHLGSRTYPLVSENCQKFMEEVKLTEEQEELFKKCVDEAYIDGQMAVFDAKDNKNNFYITPELRKRLLNHFKYVCYAEKRMFSLASKLSRLNEEMQAVTRDLYYFGEAQNISHIMIKHALENLK